jgi:CheY-like chemotaxis protein
VSKTALIVDDSRSARVVLKKMLETHELVVDTAESAEDALDYLNGNRPDVIFMDHLMPGMDGFEAVAAIKNNPDTATIPIMMYTSQEGEVYVGQARALGAVGVLPKQVEPVEVSKVLQSLRVIGRDGDSPPVGGRSTMASDASDEIPGFETLDRDLRLLIQDLFDQQRAVLRRDLLDSYETIATRVVDEIRPSEALPVDSPDIDDEKRPPGILQTAIAVLALVSMIFAALYWQREQSWQALQVQQSLLQQELENQRAGVVEDSVQTRQQLDNFQQSLGTMFSATLGSLEWGANQASSYAFSDLPLGDVRLSIIEQLDDQLLSIGFSGAVRIETHIGNFCMTSTGVDGYELASNSLLASQCDRIGMSPGEAYELGMRQSVAFANFVRQADLRSASQIRYEIISLGNSEPVIAYPETPESVSVAAWNEIAAINNRVKISLFPEN